MDSSYRFLRVSPELVRRLEEIRTALGGVAITVHSAYRPPEYNRSVGGVSTAPTSTSAATVAAGTAEGGDFRDVSFLTNAQKALHEADVLIKLAQQVVLALEESPRHRTREEAHGAADAA